jgi:hypothetical protein
MFARDIVPKAISSDHGTVFTTGIVRLTSSPSLVEGVGVVSPSPLTLMGSIVKTDVESLSFTMGVNIMEITEVHDFSESHSLLSAGVLSLISGESLRIVSEDSSAVVLLAERGCFVAATGIVPFLVASDNGAVFVTGVVRLTSSPS